MYMSSWDKSSLESYKAKCENLEKENEKYIITFSSLYDNDRQYTKKIKEQEDSLDMMSGQLAELNNTVKIQQTTISKLTELQVEELKSVNESLNLPVEDLSKARALTEATLRERDEMISAQCEKMRLLKEQSESFYEKEYESNISKIFITSSTCETKNLELVNEMGDKVKCFDEEKKAFETKMSNLEKNLAQQVKDFDDVKTEL
ncbi:hypothetical protein Tco_0438302 [Tanacetum coccineum]